MNDIRYAILIPAFNEEKTIRSVVEACLQFCKNIVVVDDGSTDATVAAIQDLPITLLKNKRNRGKDASLLRGFAHLQQHQLNAMISMDADNQHDPKEIPRFLEASKRHPHHIILGARQINAKSGPLLRRFANRVADFFISWVAGRKILDTQSGFRLYPIELIPTLLENTTRRGTFVFESHALIEATRSGYAPVALPIKRIYPKDARPSYYRPLKDTVHIVRLILRELIAHRLHLKGLYAALSKPSESET